MGRKSFAILLIAVVVSRLPFLPLGYGSDPDAWRVAYTASQLWHTGEYEPSRLPGYPLHEFLVTPLVVCGGAPAANAGTLIGCLLLLFVWRQITLKETKHPSILIVSLAFAPFMWKSSTTTMDYVWSLLAILLSLRQTLKGKTTSGGLWAGVATGFRPTNAVAIIPLIALMLIRKDPIREIGRCLAAFVVISFLSFLPLMLKYGISGWVYSTLAATSDIDFSLFERTLYFGYRSVTSIGIPAAFVAIGVVAMNRGRLLTGFQNRDQIIIVSTAGIISFLILYWFYPLEREYLLPVLPFLLLTLDRLAGKRSLVTFGGCLVVIALVNPDVVIHGGIKGTPGFNIHAGVLAEHWQQRTSLLELRAELGNLSLDSKAIVMTGGDRELWFENERLVADSSAFWISFTEKAVHQTLNPDVHFIQLLTADELRRARSAGFVVYYTAWNQEYIEKIAGYTMEGAGVVSVHLDRHP